MKTFRFRELSAWKESKKCWSYSCTCGFSEATRKEKHGGNVFTTFAISIPRLCPPPFPLPAQEAVFEIVSETKERKTAVEERLDFAVWLSRCSKSERSYEKFKLMSIFVFFWLFAGCWEGSPLSPFYGSNNSFRGYWKRSGCSRHILHGAPKRG